MYLGMALGLISGPVTARVLGPTGRGEYQSIVLFSYFVGTALLAGMPLATVHILTNRKASPGVVMGAVLRYALAVVPVAVGAGVLISLFLQQGQSHTAQVATVVFCAVAPVSIITLCLNSVLLARGWLGSLAWLGLVPLAINTVSVCVLAALHALTVETLLAVTLLGLAVSLATTWWTARVRPARGQSLRQMLGFGARAHVGHVATHGTTRIDQLLVAPLLGARELGLYAIAVSLAAIPAVLAEAVGVRLFGTVRDRGQGLDVAESERLMRLGAVVGIIPGVLLGATSWFIVPVVYGSAFRGTVLPLLLLIPGSLCFAISRTASASLIIAGQPGRSSISETIALAVSAVGLVILLPPFGIAGAAAVSTIAYLTRLLTLLIVLRPLGVRRVVPGREDVVEVAGVGLRTLGLAAARARAIRAPR
jgi:O-antigen/teichoic acid export membrane protein